MKALLFSFIVSIIFISCEKPPTIEEAKKESYGHLSDGGITDITFIDILDPTCDPAFRYRFSFTGKQEGDNIKGCICWTKPTRIYIHIYEREPSE